MSRPPRKKVERKSPAERAAEIRAAAIDLAREGGLTALTLRAVATRVGVASALVAHYEPNMEVLVADTFRSIVAGELVEVAALAEAEPTATDGLRMLLSTVLDGTRVDVTAVWVDAWSIGRRSEPLAAAIRSLTGEWHALLLGLLSRGISAGEFGAADADAVAWQLLGMIDGLNAQALVHYRDEGSRVGLIARALEQELGLASGRLAALPVGG